ncbi:hypothetical protein EYR05_21150 [Xanthomonas oryzae pv. oryzae]|nr:hypothetical protein EYR05_21150 [Xanthomonas oryzae pv. oryzae]
MGASKCPKQNRRCRGHDPLTAPERWSAVLWEAARDTQARCIACEWHLSVALAHRPSRLVLAPHRRGTLGGMDAATELTGTYVQRVPRW